jgi:carbamoyl-phosphate synthase large subunit
LPKAATVRKVLVIGPGPELIGQGFEYEAACLRACLALKAAGCQVVAVDSNPYSLLTTVGAADEVHFEPLTIEFIKSIALREKPDAILAGFGGQTAQTLGYQLAESGFLAENDIRLLGTEAGALLQAEECQSIREKLSGKGIDLPEGKCIGSVGQGWEIGEELGLPLVIRALFAPDGAGVALVYNWEEFQERLEWALSISPLGRAAVEKAIPGWPEYQFVVLKDAKGICRVIAGLERFDPTGVHCNDTPLITPIQSLEGPSLKILEEAALHMGEMLNFVGLLQVQLTQDPGTGKVYLVGTKLRWTGSAALTELTGGPDLVVTSLQLMLGLTEAAALPLVSTKGAVAVRLPRFEMERFPLTERVLDARSKVIGFSAGLGASFKEALQKAIRGLEIDRAGLGADGNDPPPERVELEVIRRQLLSDGPGRLFALRLALQSGTSPEDLNAWTGLKLRFLQEIAEIVAFEKKLTTYALYNLPPDILRQAKEWGFADIQLAYLLRSSEREVRAKRTELRVLPVCADAGGGWRFVSYSLTDSVLANPGPFGSLALGGGPSQIGSGGEAAYCAGQALQALQKAGQKTALIDCSLNLPLVLTGRGYCEARTVELIINITGIEGDAALLWQTGGPAGLALAESLQAEGMKLTGASPESIRNSIAPGRIRELAETTGLSMGDNSSLESGVALEILILADGVNSLPCGMFEQIETAGIHPRDSALAMPPYTISDEIKTRLLVMASLVGKELEAKTPLGLRCIIRQEEIFLVALDPWPAALAALTERAGGFAVIKAFIGLLLGKSIPLKEITAVTNLKRSLIKEAVLPFDRFPAEDAVLGPIQHSIGAVIGSAAGFGMAFIKAQLAAGECLPDQGAVFISPRLGERKAFAPIVEKLAAMGFTVLANAENTAYFNRMDLSCQAVHPLGAGRPNVLDMIKNGEVQWLISAASGSRPDPEERIIRNAAARRGIMLTTTLAAALAAVGGLAEYREKE